MAKVYKDVDGLDTMMQICEENELFDLLDKKHLSLFEDYVEANLPNWKGFGKKEYCLVLTKGMIIQLDDQMKNKHSMTSTTKNKAAEILQSCQDVESNLEILLTACKSYKCQATTISYLQKIQANIRHLKHLTSCGTDCGLEETALPYIDDAQSNCTAVAKSKKSSFFSKSKKLKKPDGLKIHV